MADGVRVFFLRVSQLYCGKCGFVRWGGVEHCWDCDVCYVELDHHCPWIGKCAAQGNMCLFGYFIGSIATLWGFVFFTVGVYMVLNLGKG